MTENKLLPAAEYLCVTDINNTKGYLASEEPSSSAQQLYDVTNSFHYKHRRRKKSTTPVSFLSSFSMILLICHLRFTLGFAPTYCFNKLSVPKRRCQFASPSSDERQSPPQTPFFLDDQQQQLGDTAWNTVQSIGCTQQTEGYYSEAAGSAQPQSQKEYYYYQQQQEQQQQQQAATLEQSLSSSSGISSVDARVLESILAEGKLDLNTEEEVKRLLEGPRMAEDFAAYEQDISEGSKYSSKVISVSRKSQ